MEMPDKMIFYLGPRGSFSHEVAEALGQEVKPERSISAIFQKVVETDQRGVVPIENSIEGPVNETLDGLFIHDDVYITRSIDFPIEIFLASKAEIKNIERVYSHPHAIAEAREFLEKMDNIEVISTVSTSEAADLASRDDKGAALCSKRAATEYELKHMVKIDPETPNITRFIVISRERNTDGSRHSIISIIPDEPGSLYDLIGVFSDRRINMNMIYSRPLRNNIWKYYFYIEFSGKFDVSLMESLKDRSIKLFYKGSFDPVQYKSQ
ncbi:chorismate mutase [Thermoplasma sp. Kam2015]|nr:chorismate mutase [Thermoplasma sp. Kam2015]